MRTLAFLLPFLLPRIHRRPADAVSTPHRRRYQRVSSLALLLALAAAATLVACSPFGGASSAPIPKSSPSVSSQTTSSPVQSQLAADVLRSVWSLGVKTITTTYNAQMRSATVTITLEGAVPTSPVEVSAAHELTKAYCLMALQALWTSGVSVSQTQVVVQGPTQDEYANLIDQPYGAVTLSSVTARQIDWSRVTADTAWTMYPGAFLRFSYSVED